MAESDYYEPPKPAVDKTGPGWYMSQAGVGDPSVLSYDPTMALRAQQDADAAFWASKKDTTITAKNGPMAGKEILPIFTDGATSGGREGDYNLAPKKISGYGFMPDGQHNYFYDTEGNFLFDDGDTKARFNRGMATGLGAFLGAGALSAAGAFGGAASSAGGLSAAELASLSSADLAAGPLANTLGLEAASLASADLAAGPLANTLGLETATTASTALTPAQIAASDLSVYEPFTKYGSLGAPAANLGGLTAAEINALTPAELAQYAPKGSSLYDYIKSRYTDGDGNIKWSQALKDAAVVGSAAIAYNQAKDSNNGMPTGYQGKIPEYKAIRGQLAPVEGRRPGAGGQRYLTDTLYSTEAGLPSAQAAVAAQKTALESQNAALPRGSASPNVTDLNSDKFFGRVPTQAMQTMPARPTNQQGATPRYKDFGVDSLAYEGFPGFFAKGGPTSPQGTYLRGETDGMADKIHATIDGKQPARLAHGEFVVPADVVSHLGNGNSDAGAKQLYKMMDRIRMARTGNKKQGKEINPDKFAPGGIAGYAAGGAVQHFAAGDVVPTAANGITGSESNLSNWVGPYVTNMLGKGQALSEQPYQAYQGPLTAGPSALQETGFKNAANLTTPESIGQAANTAGNIAGQPQTSSFLAPGTSQAYMNPYMQNVVDIQKQEAQRQADIASTTRQGQQTQAGAFGGSRAAVMDAEAARNLALQQGQIQATGLQSAYDAATKQFNTEQTTGLAGVNTQLTAAQTQGNLGATQNATGLANLNAQLTAGGQQQAIEQAGITADQAAFTAERDNPYKMVQYQQSLLQGLPLAAQSYNITNNPYAAAANTASSVYNMFKD